MRGKSSVPRAKKTQSLAGHFQPNDLFFEHNPLPMWVYDLETYQFLAVNHAAVNQYGYSPVEFLSMTIKDIRPSEDISRLVENVEHVIDGLDEAGVWRHLKKDGSLIFVEIISHTLEFAGRPAELVVAIDVTERTRANKALQQSEMRFRSLFEQSNDAVFILDLQGKHLLANPRAEEMLGYTKAELLTLSYRDTSVELDSSEEVLKRLLAGERVPTFERLFRKKSGEILPVEINAELVRDEEGNPLHLQSIVRDISDRKRSEASLLEREEQFRTLFENAPVGIGVADRMGNLLAFNDAMFAHTGYTRAELAHIGTVTALYYDIQEREKVLALFQSQGFVKNHEVRFKRKDGSPFYTLLSLSRTIFNSQPAILAIAEDITERKESERSLRESEDHFRSYIQNANDYIFTLDPTGKITSANQVLCETLGYAESELLGRSGLELVAPAYRTEVAKTLQLIWNGENIDVVELPIQSHDGKTILVQIRGRVLYKDGRLFETLHIARDITDQKKAEQALIDSEERYRNLFENSPVAIWVEDFSEVHDRIDTLKKEGVADLEAYFASHEETVIELIGLVRVTDVNQAALTMYEAAGKSDLLGGLLKTMPAEARAGFRHELMAIANGEVHYQSESKVRTLDGDIRDVAINWELIPGHQPMYSKVLVSLIDITERKQAEDEARRQVQRLNALREIDRTIISSFDMHLSLNTLLMQALSLLEVDAADILMFNPILNMLEYAGGIGFRTNLMDTSETHLGDGYARRVALDRDTVHIPDFKEEPVQERLIQLIQKEGFVSYHGVPLIAKGLVLGVMEIYHRKNVERDREWLDFLEALSDQAAIAIDNAQTYNTLQRTNNELVMAYDATIAGWSHAMDLRDKETEGHTQRVTDLTLKLAERMGIGASELVHIRRGALLHDIGKLGVPDSILLKPGTLTDDEWEIMKRHPTLAREMLSSIVYLRYSIDIPYCHHEKWDGSGYPQGLKGEQIPLAARLFSIVDVWDALTSHRPYRPAWTVDETLRYIREQSGKHFDPQIVETFMGMIAGM